ncbi:MAG: hypothetical protein E6J45_13740 [Chloroflexi bacterium]|nr:MAG: hypothetical protein E6J45_13740 [Chloroflexota bacterium]
MLTVLEGNNFLVADDRGDVLTGSDGLYYNDTRYLSRWRLLLNGERPQLLSSGTVDYYSAAVYMQNVATPALPAGAVSLIRELFVGEGGMQNSIHIENHLLDPVELQLTLEFEFDFLDLFEVKAREYREEDLVFTDRTQPRLGVEALRDERENSWSFTLHDGEFRAQALVWVAHRGETEQTSVTHTILLQPGDTWQTRAHVVLLHGGDQRRQRYTSFYFGQERVRVEESLRAWRLHAPELVTDWEDLRNTYHRSLADLAALRMRPRNQGIPLRDLPAAGLPWFMTVFGRDTLITSFQTMLLGSSLAAGTLEALAALQSTERDDQRDAEPGKIVHELRVGRVAVEGGAFPYYGSVDSTILFLILLSELYRWTGDLDAVAALREPAMNALRWIREQGDLDGDGYIEYHRRSQNGLESQSWKDSWDSMRFRDGLVARTPIATAEVQGYAYDARVRTAELLRRVWGDEPLAAELEAEAETLKERFNDDFFLDGEGGAFPYYGSVDSTILFLILLSELYRWTGDLDAVTALREPAMNALRWIRQPDRLPHRHRLAARQQPGDGGPLSLRLPAVREPDRLDDDGGRSPLPLPHAGGVCRLHAGADAVSGRLSDRLLAAGLGGRRPGAVSAQHAGSAPRP